MKTKDVFVIQPATNGGRSFFRKAGVAFVNKDGSLNVKLDVFPHVQFHIRDRKEKKRES